MATAGQHYIFDCGTEDEQRDDRTKQKIPYKLTEQKIQHLYIESLGAHDTSYWSRSLS
jgi:hypothetical protein